MIRLRQPTKPNDIRSEPSPHYTSFFSEYILAFPILLLFSDDAPDNRTGGASLVCYLQQDCSELLFELVETITGFFLIFQYDRRQAAYMIHAMMEQLQNSHVSFLHIYSVYHYIFSANCRLQNHIVPSGGGSSSEMVQRVFHRPRLVLSHRIDGKLQY